MDSKELRGLLEAYSEVYAPEEIEETVKGQSSETRRDMAAERKRGIKPLSAKEGEKYASHKLSQMAYAKRKRMGEEIEEVGEEMKPLPKNKMFRKAGNLGRDIVSPATSDEDRQKKHSRQNKIIRTLNKANEEFDVFDTVLEFLQAEGYAETLEEAEWMMANIIDEEAIDIILDEAMTKYERNRKRAAQRAAARNAARDQGKTGAVPGVGYVTPRRERETWTDESGKTRHAKGL